MKIKTLKYFIFLVLIVLGSTLFAQEDDCYTVLERAEVLYEEGVIEELSSLLQPCIEKGFTREQKLKAYKLIIFAYLFDDNQLAAQRAMLEFLKKYPEYEPRRSDPVEFVYLFNSYKTSIAYSVAVMAGMNFVNINTIERFSTGNENDQSGRSKKTSVGSQFGIQVNRNLGDNFEMSMELYSTKNKFEFRKESQIGVPLVMKESQSRLDIPLSLAYKFDYKDFNPFIRAGFGLSIINKSTAQFLYDEVVTGADIDITDHRNKYNYFWLFGAGVKYKVPRGYAVFDCRYNFGIKDMMINKHYTNTKMWSRDQFVEDKFTLDNITFSVGYVLLIYTSSNKRR